MSEPVLKAIIQLLAMSASIDGVITASEREVTCSFLDEHLNQEEVPRFEKLFDDYADTALQAKINSLNIAQHINQELNQRQKIIVVFHLLELISSDGEVGLAEEKFVDDLAHAFNIDIHEYNIIKAFVTDDNVINLGLSNVIKISGVYSPNAFNCIYKAGYDATIGILRIPSLQMYMLKYFKGSSNTTLNGVSLKDRHIYTFPNGASIRADKITPIYYSDVVSKFMQEEVKTKLSFEAKHVYYTFSGGKVGLRDINLSEEGGRLIGLMGASGSGKSTLLNVLNGIAVPVGGQVLINGINIHDDEEKKAIEGVIGYVPQDDLLIEELTVYQNMYYAAKLCFGGYSEQEIHQLVEKTLVNLGLQDTKALKVGNPLQKTISGGQRKRLNIALELLREPSVLFVDEPTSGLSSNDSENILDLLKELSLKGKLIFVVIHQPSSEIFKMFDRLIILDVGGYQIYYGDPVDAVIYFRSEANLINSEQGSCPTCGNVNPEQIFSIIETKVVDEYGRYTKRRKTSPVQWYKSYTENIPLPQVKTIEEAPEASLSIPSKWKQFRIFSRRDLKAKLSNSQYMSISLLEAPLLALILSYIVRYYHIDQSAEAQGYIFSENVNLPAYLFMSVIVALFVGLTVSAEEIIKDAKIRKRERFLHLSRTSYLFSKITILFSFSALQTLSFVLIGNFVLGIHGMTFEYWIVLFSTACFANMLGLNISATFNSVITIYILIPILLIPQLILGGIVVKFDDINPHLASENKVPIVSEIMTARWAFEALAVAQFKHNEFEKDFYGYDKIMGTAEYKKVYYIPKLSSKLAYIEQHFRNNKPEIREVVDKDFELLKTEISSEIEKHPKLVFSELKYLNRAEFDAEIAKATEDFLEVLRKYYVRLYNAADKKKNHINQQFIKKNGRDAFIIKKQTYQNQSIKDLVEDANDETRIVEQNAKLVQKIYPIYQDPIPQDWWDFRSHFFAPKKHFLGQYFDTLAFNVFAIWMMTFIFYFTLYYKVFRVSLAALSSFSRLYKSKKKR